MPRKIILDCDPGHDDALAVFLAAGTPGIEIAGVTTVAGNNTLAKTTLNARRICSLAGMNGVTIAAGCDRPILRENPPSSSIHGESGLDGTDFPEPTVEVSPEHAVEFIVRTLLDSDGDVTLVATAPLTNLAMALRREPRIAAKAREVVLMGGSYTRGNVTPAAEFNMAADPEAAAIVFGASWHVTMVGLDVTRQALATRPVIERITALRTPVSCVVAELLEFSRSTYARRGYADPPVHDPCAVARVGFPELVEVTPAFVTVETKGDWTAGMTVVDFDRALGRPANVDVATGIDAASLWDRVLDALERLGGGTKLDAHP